MASASGKIPHKKPKLVRDSFTIPKTEFAAIDALKTRAMTMGTSVKKSELLRAGLMLLTGLSDSAFKAAVAAVPTLKTGRPAAQDTSGPAPARPAAARKPVKAPTPKTAPGKTIAKAAAKSPAKAAPKPAPQAAAKPKAPARKARMPAAKAATQAVPSVKAAA